MNELKIFNNTEFGKFRIIDVEGKIYFVAREVAVALGYKDVINSIKQHCRGVVKHHLPTNGGKQLLNIISEGDLYRLITHSKLPTAEKFENWVFDEVLPEIRRTGSYSVKPQQQSPEPTARILVQFDKARKALTALDVALDVYKIPARSGNRSGMDALQILAINVTTEVTNILRINDQIQAQA